MDNNGRIKIGIRDYWRLSMMLGMLAIMLLALVWLGTWLRSSFEYKMEINTHIRENANLARALEDSVRHNLEAADELLLIIKDECEQNGGVSDATRNRVSNIRSFPVNRLNIINAAGRISENLLPPTSITDVSDREYFSVHTQDDTLGMVIAKPVIGRSTGNKEVYLSRRINKPDGGFGGVVALALNPTHFSDFYRQMNLGGQQTIALLGMDGIVRAWQQGGVAGMGQDVREDELFQRVLHETSESYSGQGILTQKIPSIISYRVLPDYPLILAVVVSEEETLTSYYQRRNGYYLMATVLTAFILLTFGFLLRLSVRQGLFQAQLRVSEEKYRSLVENINVGIYRTTTNDRGRFIQANPAARRMFGYDSAAEFMETRIEELYQHTRERQVYLTDMRQYGFVRNQELALRKKDGTPIWCNCSAVAQVDEQGEILWIDTVLEDITERKMAQEALQQAHSELENIVAIRTQELYAANQELMAMNLDLISVNEALRDANQTLAEEIAERQRAEEELRSLYQQLQQAQETLIRSEKMAALARLVSGIAHEINTPVGISVTLSSHLTELNKDISGRLDVGSIRRSDLSEYITECDETAQLLLLNTMRAAELVRNIKQVAADQAGEIRRKFAVRDYVEEILVLLKTELKSTGHIVEIQGERDLMMDGYPGAFAQILTNLVLNSLTHAYDPGKAGRIYIAVDADRGEWLTMTYSDDGKGMDCDVRSKIFDPFFTTRRNQGGTGLGLSIVYNLVTMLYGGTIECQSQVEVGTTFVVRLPLEVNADLQYGNIGLSNFGFGA